MEVATGENGVKRPRLEGAGGEESGDSCWVVAGSRESHDCVNPVRSCEEKYFREPMEKRDKSKSLIKLSIGDPSVFGNLPPPPSATEGVQQAVASLKYNGYAHSSGLLETRQAVADHYSTPQHTFTPEDVVMTHSGSGAILMSLEVLCEPGSVLLVPTPGFGLYQCHADAMALTTKLYKLLPKKNWEIDLADLERLFVEEKGRVSALVVNNPSNPCGSVYSRQHLQDVLKLAEKYRCPIISDDIYQDMVFEGVEYVSFTSLCPRVPILSCGGISKRFMVPGWRLGWIMIVDRGGAFEKEVRPGLSQLAMKLLGPCTLIQAALPHMLSHTPKEYHDRNMEVFRRNAELVYEGLNNVPGCFPVMPAGTMYMMVTIDLDGFSMDSDVTFTKTLLMEESVFCLPGMAFNAQKCFRIVLIMPDQEIEEALRRIQVFCSRHYSKVER